MKPVPLNLLEALAAEAPTPEAPHVPPGGNNGNGHYTSRLKVAEWLQARGCEFKVKDKPDRLGRTVYLLTQCPFDPTHGATHEVAIFQEPGGKLAAACMHNSCHGRGWQDFKEKIGKPDRHHDDPPLQAAGIHGGTAWGGRRADEADASSPASSKRAQLSQAEVLLSLADGQDYFHASDGLAFARVEVETGGRVHEETLPIRGKDFRNWLSRRYFLQTKRAPSTGILKDALNVLDARARYEGPEREVWCRVADLDGKVYLDLADHDWRVVEVGPDGWRVLARSPVCFRRPRGMLALPEPVTGGSLDQLRAFLNLDAGKDDWLLVVGWLVQALSPTGPYPVLCLYGEQGSAKSTTSRVLRSLVDPSTAPLRTVPRDERDLIIAASNSWLVTLDNVSRLDGWLSDALPPGDGGRVLDPRAVHRRRGSPLRRPAPLSAQRHRGTEFATGSA